MIGGFHGLYCYAFNGEFSGCCMEMDLYRFNTIRFIVVLGFLLVGSSIEVNAQDQIGGCYDKNGPEDIRHVPMQYKAGGWNPEIPSDCERTDWDGQIVLYCKSSEAVDTDLVFIDKKCDDGQPDGMFKFKAQFESSGKCIQIDNPVVFPDCD